jgi:hypothetical protein
MMIEKFQTPLRFRAIEQKRCGEGASHPKSISREIYATKGMIDPGYNRSLITFR